jgi:hypothetical protein
LASCTIEADRPRAVDDHEVAEPDLRLLDRVQRGGEHLDERTLLVAHRVGQLVGVLSLRAHVFRKGAVRGHTEHDREVEVRISGAGEVAGRARLDGIDRDAVSLLHALGVLAARDDAACELVPQDERALAVSRPDGTASHVVLEVRTADPAGRDLDEHILVADLRLRHVLEADVLDVVKDCCSHRLP